MDDFDIHMDALPYTYEIPPNTPLRGRPSMDWDPVSWEQHAYANMLDGYDPVCGWTNHSFPPSCHNTCDRFEDLRRRRRYSDGWRRGNGEERGRYRYPFMYELECEWDAPGMREQRYNYRDLPYRHRRRSMRFPWKDYPSNAHSGVFGRPPRPARSAGEAEEVKEDNKEYEVEELETDADETRLSNVADVKKPAGGCSKIRSILPPPGTRLHTPEPAQQNASARAARAKSPEKRRSSEKESPDRLSLSSSSSELSSDLPSDRRHPHASNIDKIRKARKAISKKREKLIEAEDRLTEEEHRVDEWEVSILTEGEDLEDMRAMGEMEETNVEGWWSVLSEFDSGEEGEMMK